MLEALCVLTLLVKELWSRSIVQDECWLWTGESGGNGYGRLRIDSRKYHHVHRLSAFIFLGLNILDKKCQALHKLECPNKNCWNPDHIYVGVHKDNMRDRKVLDGYSSNSGASIKAYCSRGHERIQENLHNYSRNCKICQLELQRKRRRSLKERS